MKKSNVITVLIFVCMCFVTIPAFAAEVYVYVSASTGTNAPGSGSMGSPYASINYAISQNAGTASDPVTIRVAAGTYIENLVLGAYQSLNGGYAVDFSTRNLDDLISPEYATIIDGNGAGRVISIDGSSGVSREVSGFSIANGSSSGSGGGITGNYCQTRIRYNRIYNNYTSTNGGGLYGCDGAIEYCQIFENTCAGNGGAIADSYVDLTECYIYDNHAYGSGGGLYVCNNEDIIDCHIYGNTADLYAGGAYSCTSDFTGCLIYENEATSNGGGFSDCSGSIHGCKIYNNISGGRGGGIYGCDNTIANTLVYFNTADLDGGGLAECTGGLINNTVYGNNSGDDGGGVYNCTGTILNCIIYGNTAADSGDQGSGSSIPNFCCIEDWVSGGTGNISSNPQLAEPGIGQFHLMTGSPCIDAGTDSGLAVDMDKEARPYNALYDMGADEYYGSDSAAPTFDHFLRGVPRGQKVLLEWNAASDPGTPISYLIYGSLDSGGHTFATPVGEVLGKNALEVFMLFPTVPHYMVPRAEDCYGNQTSNTDEYPFYITDNIIGDPVYNSDFEELPPIRSPQITIPPTPPDGWGSSSQDYGSKMSYFDVTTEGVYEGDRCATIETFVDTPVPDDDLSIASLVSETSFALEKDHTYAVSAAVRRSDSQWTRFILFSSGFSIIHTESIDALDDQSGDSGWEIMYFHFRAPINLNAYVRIDSMVTNKRTAGERTCTMWVDDVQVIDLGVETYTDIYASPQYGIRNRYFDLTTDTEVSTIGGSVYSSTDMPRRWNMAMAVDTGSNDTTGYPVWGQMTPPGLLNTTGEAGYVKTRATDTTNPAWPALAADGVLYNSTESNGARHILTFNYGAAGVTLPLLRVFMINNNFSHYSSLFLDPVIDIPGNRMWPLSLQYTPAYGDTFFLVRFDNVTIGASGSGPHTAETTMYLDNVVVSKVD